MIAKLLRQSMNHQYPLMRDPQRQPKCYELTDEERAKAVQKVDQLLKSKVQSSLS